MVGQGRFCEGVSVGCSGRCIAYIKGCIWQTVPPKGAMMGWG
jgi:hypothetical protein